MNIVQPINQCGNHMAAMLTMKTGTANMKHDQNVFRHDAISDSFCSEASCALLADCIVGKTDRLGNFSASESTICRSGINVGEWVSSMVSNGAANTSELTPAKSTR